MRRDSKHLVDPELIPAIDPYPPLDTPIESLATVRAEFAAMLATVPIREDLPVQREEVQAPGPAGAPPVRVLLYRPANGSGPWPAVLHIHGGGYVLGAPEFADPYNHLLVASLGCVVCSVDHRLAPEHPHPAPVQDCYPGAFHGFGAATEARTTLAAARDSREALRRAMFG